MVGDFVRGFAAPWSGLAALRTPGLGPVVVLPIIISIAVFMVVILSVVAGFDVLMEWLLARLPGWLEWLQWLLWPLFAVVALLLGIYTFTMLANLVAAPFNGVLAARYETLLTGTGPGVAEDSLLSATLAAFGNEIRKLFYLLRWLLLAGLLFLVPGINLLAPAVWLALGAWLLALEYLAYPMDNHGLPAAAQLQTLRRQRGMALGFGAAVMLMSALPVINLLAMPAGVLGATRLWCEARRAGGR